MGRILDPAFVVGQQHGGLAVHRRGHVLHQDRGEVVEVAAGRQFAAQRVQLASAPLAMARDRRLATAERGQAADDQADHQHHGEGDHVLGVGDVERVIRRHEQEVERQHAEHRAGDRGTAAEAPAVTAVASRYTITRLIRSMRPASGRQTRVATATTASALHRQASAGTDRDARRRHRGLALLAADDVDVDRAACADQLVDQRALQAVAPARRSGLPTMILADVARRANAEQCRGDAFATEILGFGAELLGETSVRMTLVARRLRQAHERRRLDDTPPAMQRACARAMRRAARTSRVDSGSGPTQTSSALAGGPGAGDRVALAIFAHRRIHAIGGRAQRQLAQRDQVALAEEFSSARSAFSRHVDLALAQAFEQVVRRQVDQLDLVRALERRDRAWFRARCTPVICATTSFRLSMCWTLTVE